MKDFTEILNEGPELAIEAQVAILVNKKLMDLKIVSKPILKASKVNMNGKITTIKNLTLKNFTDLALVLKHISLNIQYVANNSGVMIILDYYYEMNNGGSNNEIVKFRYNFNDKKWDKD